KLCRMTMPTDPGAPVTVIPPLTQRQFWALVGSVIGMVITGYIGLIYVLVNIVYGGIDSRLKTLEGHFDTAISASANVKHLLDTAPTLEHQITEMRIDVKGLKDSMDLLNP